MRIQGVIPPNVSLDQALRYLEDEARSILPKDFVIDYAGESRRLNRREQVPRHLSPLGSPDLPGARRPVRELPRSLRHPGGSVPLALSGALLFSFLGFTTLNIYSQVGLITLVGLVAKNGILIVQFANHLRRRPARTSLPQSSMPGDPACPILSDECRDLMGHMLLTLRAGRGPERGTRSASCS